MTADKRPLATKDPHWRTEVLDYFTKRNYQESLPRALNYLQQLPQTQPDICRERAPGDFATVHYTIAASAYGVLTDTQCYDESTWSCFFEHLQNYIDVIKSNDKTGLYPKNVETLLENALDLLICFRPEQLADQSRCWVKGIIDAWSSEELALTVLLKKVFDERMDFKHRDGMKYTQILANLYLQLSKPFGDSYHAEQAAVMNILSDLCYFEGGENSEEQALQWIEQSLMLNPNDEFAKRRKKNIHNSLAIADQIRRFNHDANNEIGGLKSNLQKMKSLLSTLPGNEASLHCLQKINNAVLRIAGVHRFVQKQMPDFKSVDLIGGIIQPLLASYNDRLNITLQPQTPVEWEVDADYLRLALDNLIKNSQEAFERRQIDPAQRQLSITVQPSPDILEIQIQDNAGGIDPKYYDTLFEPYVSSKGVQKQTGLGLYNAKTAIESMEGSLELASQQPENGTLFIIRLPQ
ncbi:ATP-binding protein [Methylotuvimicrobium sp. KM2]|uniref:sensor histidine kinase n=1 Tax=Methylotuvimicrobium sp. KM2 TaxID=3133976 RepID=UPI003101A1BD